MSPGYLGAIYHGSMPAWGTACKPLRPETPKPLIGCLFRNVKTVGIWESIPPCTAWGSDSGVHTQDYAFCAPSEIEDTTTGKVLREAMNYHTPLLAAAVPVASTGPLPGAFSLGSVSTGGAVQALITAVKGSSIAPDEVILRVYQPVDHPTL